jgi:hypothetical protein
VQDLRPQGPSLSAESLEQEVSGPEISGVRIEATTMAVDPRERAHIQGCVGCSMSFYK